MLRVILTALVAVVVTVASADFAEAQLFRIRSAPSAQCGCSGYQQPAQQNYYYRQPGNAYRQTAQGYYQPQQRWNVSPAQAYANSRVGQTQLGSQIQARTNQLRQNQGLQNRMGQVRNAPSTQSNTAAPVLVGSVQPAAPAGNRQTFTADSNLQLVAPATVDQATFETPLEPAESFNEIAAPSEQPAMTDQPVSDDGDLFIEPAASESILENDAAQSILEIGN